MLILLNLDTKKLSCKITKRPSPSFPEITVMHVTVYINFLKVILGCKIARQRKL